MRLMLPVIVPSDRFTVSRPAQKLQMTNFSYAVIGAWLSSRLVAVNATPNGAVVWVSAQPVRFVKVVGIGLWPARRKDGRRVEDTGAHFGEVPMGHTRRMCGRDASVS